MSIHSLKSIPLFSALEEKDLAILAALMQEKSVPRNTVIINEGDEADKLFVIISGQVKVFLCDETGKELILNVEGPGEYIGEISLLDDEPRSASVMSTEPSEFLVMSKSDFHRAMRSNPDLSFGICRALTYRLRANTNTMRNLGLKNVYQRIVNILYDMAEEDSITGQSNHEADGILTVRQKLTHQNIADMIGSSREMVSRIIKDLERGNYIKIERKQISILRKLPAGW